MKLMNNRGLSPVIATVLLIALAVILASLVFLWANSLLKERAQKFGEPAENSCGDIRFEAEIVSENGMYSLFVVNQADIPLYSMEIKKKSTATIEKVEVLNPDGQNIRVGETAEISLSDTEINSGDEIIVTPIILGAISEGKLPVVCEEAEKEIIAE